MICLLLTTLALLNCAMSQPQPQPLTQQGGIVSDAPGVVAHQGTSGQVGQNGFTQQEAIQKQIQGNFGQQGQFLPQNGYQQQGGYPQQPGYPQQVGPTQQVGIPQQNGYFQQGGLPVQNGHSQQGGLPVQNGQLQQGGSQPCTCAQPHNGQYPAQQGYNPQLIYLPQIGYPQQGFGRVGHIQTVHPQQGNTIVQPTQEFIPQGHYLIGGFYPMLNGIREEEGETVKSEDEE